jgi:hypothetical protein
VTFEQELKEAFKRYMYIPRTKVDYWTFRKLRALKSRVVGAKGWDEWFKYLARDVNIEPSLHERVMYGTFKVLMQTWMHNFGDNILNIRYGDDITEQITNGRILISIPENFKQTTVADLAEWAPILENEPEYAKAEAKEGRMGEIAGMKVKCPPKGSAIVVGRGPSLFKHGQLKLLAEKSENGEYNGIVVASDGALIPCLEAGVIPDYVVSVDGAPIIRKWFEHPLVEKYGEIMKWVASVTINHDVYLAGRKAGLEVYWFNPTFDDWRQNETWTRLQRLLSTTPKYDMGVPAMNSGGNAGACAWIFAMQVLKRSPVALIGVDFGYPEGTPLQETQYFNQILAEAHGDLNVIKEAYPKFYHPVFKEHAFADLIFFHYRQAFIDLQEMTDLWYRLYGGTINCTEGGTLFGQGITCMKLQEFLEKWKK